MACWFCREKKNNVVDPEWLSPDPEPTVQTIPDPDPTILSKEHILGLQPDLSISEETYMWTKTCWPTLNYKLTKFTQIFRWKKVGFRRESGAGSGMNDVSGSGSESLSYPESNRPVEEKKCAFCCCKVCPLKWSVFSILSLKFARDELGQVLG